MDKILVSLFHIKSVGKYLMRCKKGDRPAHLIDHEVDKLKMCAHISIPHQGVKQALIGFKPPHRNVGLDVVFFAVGDEPIPLGVYYGRQWGAHSSSSLCFCRRFRIVWSSR